MGINAEVLENVLKNEYGYTYEDCSSVVVWHGYEFNCKKYVPLSVVDGIIKMTVDASFNEDGVYSPAISMFTLKAAIISLYTDIELPDDVEKMATIINGTDLYDSIISEIDNNQYSDICSGIEKSMAYVIKTNVVEVNKSINDLVASLSSISDGFSKAFEGVSGEDLINIATSLSSHEITEENIVRALARKEEE